MNDTYITYGLVDRLMEDAVKSPRLRCSLNIHASLEEACQRIVNVLLPVSIVPVHRHRATDETIVVLCGKMDVVLYGETGGVSSRHRLDPREGRYGLNIPKGQWHTVEVLEPTAIFEVKDGPYCPLEPEDIMY
ncbi:MAG: cupin fold metalloprotein, WbuC family [Bacteroides sp.]|nr:cupin fold metalloprotein, WbuC family [Bacteroides sp.]